MVAFKCQESTCHLKDLFVFIPVDKRDFQYTMYLDLNLYDRVVIFRPRLTGYTSPPLNTINNKCERAIGEKKERQKDKYECRYISLVY